MNKRENHISECYHVALLCYCDIRSIASCIMNSVSLHSDVKKWFFGFAQEAVCLISEHTN